MSTTIDRCVFTGITDPVTSRPMAFVVGEPDAVEALSMARTVLNVDAVEFLGFVESPAGRARRYRTSLFARPLVA